ncbi:MAG: nitrous oxide reductase family maturation protein NosD [Candidatus Hodarchaeota archaeon]
MNTSKVMFIFFVIIISLCVVKTQPVKSQDIGIIYIASDGSISSTTNDTIPIQQDGNVYTFTDNIDGNSIVVQCDNIVIDGAGYSLSGGGALVGIDLSYRKNVTIKNMQLGLFFYAIYLANASGNTITENALTYNSNGVYLIDASQNAIIRNNMTNNEIDINIISSSTNIFRDNSLNNSQNLAIYGTEPSHFDNDIDESNTVNGKKIYYLTSESNLVISPSTFPNLGYLALIYCNNITVNDLELTNNGQGVVLAFTTESTITQNNLTDNYVGISLFSSSDNSIVDNHIINNYRGIQLSSSNGNTLSGNNMTDNMSGIFLFDSLLNGIIGNNITNNGIGIGFEESSNNVIRNNFFINNTEPVYDAHMDNSSILISMNLWNFSYPLGGNYWSSYTGVDEKSGANQDQPGTDGIGDTPYVIYENNIDNFPLLPYTRPPAIIIISPENKTYPVTSISFAFTVSEPTSWTAYSIDGQASVEITEDKTLEGLTVGSHSLTIYVKYENGFENSATVYFTVGQGAESLSFPIAWVVVIIVMVVIVVTLLIYFKKKKHYSSVNISKAVYS